MESNNPRISRKKVARTQDRQSNHTHRSNSSSGLDGFWRCSFCKLSLYSSFRSSLFVLFLLRRLRASIIFPLAPAVEVNESLHAAPFGDFALHPCKVYRLGIQTLALFLHQVLNWKCSLTFVKKSLHPAANASCLSLCRLLAVNATIITGLLNNSFSSSSPSVALPSCMTSTGLPLKTPIPFTPSSRLISLVASNPFMTGN